MANLQNSSKDLHKELASYLRMIISESSSLVKDAKATKNNAIVEESTTLQMLVEGVAKMSTVPPRKRSLKRSIVIGQLFDHNFAISEDSIFSKVNMNELPDLERKINHEHCFTFNDRLKGWNIECRQRENTKMSDMYYYHLGSNKKFRSIVEVVDFILYERYPSTQRKNKDETMIIESSTRKRQRKSSWKDGRKKMQNIGMTKEDVQKFMIDAFKIFQDGAYEEELKKKKDFKYSDYFIFVNKESNFDSIVEEDKQKNKVEDSMIEQKSGVTQGNIFCLHNMTTSQDITKAPKTNATEIEAIGNDIHKTSTEAKNSSRKFNENLQATQFGGQEIQQDTIVGKVLPQNVNKSLEEDSEIIIDNWQVNPTKEIARLLEELIPNM